MYIRSSFHCVTSSPVLVNLCSVELVRARKLLFVTVSCFPYPQQRLDLDRSTVVLWCSAKLGWVGASVAVSDHTSLTLPRPICLCICFRLLLLTVQDQHSTCIPLADNLCGSIYSFQRRRHNTTEETISP